MKNVPDPKMWTGEVACCACTDFTAEWNEDVTGWESSSNGLISKLIMISPRGMLRATYGPGKVPSNAGAESTNGCQ